ncbi:hypothetical protein OE88DRAFT_735075 [Heliocybe sulcata]|uniref:UvrD-like helicase ATP-binding domain-containing protein n=1 Tax=Heliocybe sulcata TaxID=5364 RepID=A0A5C3MRX9_9AGAM|nr:hypothetical protein OE88DRAFT_735075 [Heliocybe sulcata]
MADEYVKCLNTEQLRAVRQPHHVPLQILAGPGSGKTKVRNKNLRTQPDAVTRWENVM